MRDNTEVRPGWTRLLYQLADVRTEYESRQAVLQYSLVEAGAGPEHAWQKNCRYFTARLYLSLVSMAVRSGANQPGQHRDKCPYHVCGLGLGVGGTKISHSTHGCAPELGKRQAKLHQQRLTSANTRVFGGSGGLRLLGLP